MMLRAVSAWPTARRVIHAHFEPLFHELNGLL